jgi:hypothetical protein
MKMSIIGAVAGLALVAAPVAGANMPQTHSKVAVNQQTTTQKLAQNQDTRQRGQEYNKDTTRRRSWGGG